jgi:V8-like Glu-specific endopeptidase
MTCLIVDELQPDGSVKHGYGTAFFVADNILLTAGHNLVSRRGYNIIGIRVTIPGTKVVQLGSDGILTLRCKIISNSFKGFNGSCGREDIAILKCSGLATPARYLPLATDHGNLSPRAIVDVIGYPGFIETAWIERQHKGKLKNFEESAKVARKMLPERTLTVSRGSVEEIKDGLCSYRVSTCPGMSGGALISKGNVYGNFPILGRCLS